MSKKTGYFKRYAMTLLFPLGMYAVFALITLIIGNASFFTGYTTEGIIHDTVENTIIALAIAIPLSGGRWDFGPGAIIMLGAIIGGNLGMQLHMGTFGVLLCCVGACMMLALIEAVFYVTLRVPNMIISMGIVMVYEAVSGLLNNGLGVNFFANDTESRTLNFSSKIRCARLYCSSGFSTASNALACPVLIISSTTMRCTSSFSFRSRIELVTAARLLDTLSATSSCFR